MVNVKTEETIHEVAEASDKSMRVSSIDSVSSLSEIKDLTSHLVSDCEAGLFPVKLGKKLSRGKKGNLQRLLTKKTFRSLKTMKTFRTLKPIKTFVGDKNEDDFNETRKPLV